MEIKDNELLRQFETTTSNVLISVEYALQERKIFLTKWNVPAQVDENLAQDFLVQILELLYERKMKVVPTHPKIVSFFRKNKKYNDLLPPGIKI